MSQPLRLSYREWRRLSRRAYASQQRDQSEVCGLFASDGRRGIRLFFVKNESCRPGHFEFGWDQFWRARESVRAEGCRYLGVFHSHPITEAIPGPGDLRRARPNSLMLIHDVCGVQARLWRVVKRGGRKGALEVPLVIERSRGQMRRHTASFPGSRVPINR